MSPCSPVSSLWRLTPPDADTLDERSLALPVHRPFPGVDCLRKVPAVRDITNALFYPSLCTNKGGIYRLETPRRTGCQDGTIAVEKAVTPTSLADPSLARRWGLVPLSETPDNPVHSKSRPSRPESVQIDRSTAAPVATEFAIEESFIDHRPTQRGIVGMQLT